MQLFKDKNSKFLSYCFPIESEIDVKTHLSNIKSKHPQAGHFCYAYQLGTTKIMYRLNDDGEPKNSAGAPIYGQILSFGLTNIVVIVVRYFGGTKLGVGGLISAYKTATQMALQSAHLIEKSICISYIISYDYNNMDKIMRVIKKHNITIVSQKMELSCETIVSVPKKNAENTIDIFENLFNVTIKRLT